MNGWRAVRRFARPWFLRQRLRTRGSFSFYDHEIRAPLGSIIFERWATEGQFEPDVIQALVSLALPNTWVLDIGANIGLLSAALLSLRRDVKLASVECSPSTLPYLRQTHSDSPFKDRWMLIESAVGRESGKAEFYTSGGELAAYDGLRDTGRGGAPLTVSIEVRTLDEIWGDLGRPTVSLVKIDIEGGERDALSGGAAMLQHCKPIVLMEWHRDNLQAYGIDPQAIFDFEKFGYRPYALETLQPLTEALLPLAMARSEMFILAPLRHGAS